MSILMGQYIGMLVIEYEYFQNTGINRKNIIITIFKNTKYENTSVLNIRYLVNIHQALKQHYSARITHPLTMQLRAETRKNIKHIIC